VISMDGGPPRRIEDTQSWAASWSPDGNRVVFADYSDRPHVKFRIYDLHSGLRSDVPGTEEFIGVQWVAEDVLIAATSDRTRLLVFDLKTQKWSDLVSLPKPGTAVNWIHTPDGKYLYYTTGGTEPQLWRVRLADHKAELITSLKELSRATDASGFTQLNAAPDGSPVFTRDIGTQEIYALTVKWP